MKIETAVTFENPEDESALQIDIDTNGYSLTVFDADAAATMNMDRPTLERLAHFIFTAVLYTNTNTETN